MNSHLMRTSSLLVVALMATATLPICLSATSAAAQSYSESDSNQKVILSAFAPGAPRPSASNAFVMFFGYDSPTKVANAIGDTKNAQLQINAWMAEYNSIDKTKLETIEAWRSKIEAVLNGSVPSDYAVASAQKEYSRNPAPVAWIQLLTDEAVAIKVGSSANLIGATNDLTATPSTGPQKPPQGYSDAPVNPPGSDPAPTPAPPPGGGGGGGGGGGYQYDEL